MNRKSTEIRQREIKQALLTIIKNDGIGAVSTKRLAEEVNISGGAIFRHFNSKRDIIFSIIHDVSIDFIGSLEVIANSDRTPRDKLELFVCRTIEYLTEHDGITMLLFSEASHFNDRTIMEKLRHIFNSQRLFVGEIIKEGVSSGIWDNAVSIEDVTMLYMGIPITLNVNLILSKGTFQKKEFCRKMIALLERILRIE